MPESSVLLPEFRIGSFPDDPARLDPLVRQIADIAAETDAEEAFPEQAFQWLAEAGLLSITLPGQALDFRLGQTDRLLHLLKRIGTANLAVGRVYEGHINALYLIHLFADPARRDRWYTDVRGRNFLFSVWNTQDAQGVRIDEQATSDERVYRLSGAKTFCSGSGWIQRPLITGELRATYTDGSPRQGWQMVVVPTERINSPAIDPRFWQPLGMRASASFRIDFSGIELGDDDLLGQPGQYLQQPYFSGGAIRFAAVQLGGAEALLDETRRFLQRMHRTDDLMQQSRLAEMTYLIESGNQWISSAGKLIDQWLSEGENGQKIVAYANMTRTAIEEICLRVMPLAERCVGARGLLRPEPFERIHRDLTHYLRQPAPDASLLGIGQYVLHNANATHDLWR